MKNVITIILFSFLLSGLKAQSFDYYYQMADSLMTTNKFDSAIIYYDSSLKENTSCLNCYFNRGLCYFYLEKFKLALNDFETYITKERNDADAYLFRADCKKELNDSIGSLKDYDTAVIMSPNDPKLRIERGKLRSLMF